MDEQINALLKVLAKDAAEAEVEERKYFSTPTYQYYEGYRDAIEFALGKAREHLVRGSGSNTR